MIVVWQTFRFNTFAAPQVRIQKDREHRVITDGPERSYAGGRRPGCKLRLLSHQFAEMIDARHPSPPSEDRRPRLRCRAVRGIGIEQIGLVGRG
jgi:hypothetical protein